MTCNLCRKGIKTAFWCGSCNSSRFQQEFGNWTSGNDDVDAFIRKVQLTATRRHKILEWISYSKFKNVELIDKGGFGEVYLAEWSEGSIVYWSAKNRQWKRTGPKKVALKFLNDSQNITKEFLNEIKNLLDCNDKVSHVTRCYGITRHPVTCNYIIVMQFAEDGSVRNRLSKFSEMPWEDKFKILFRIAVGLHQMHEAGLVHRDFHPGNILLSRNTALYITDLGLCKPVFKYTSSKDERKVYGVLPYVAPEVLCGKEYTEAADIYAFGIIMSEMLSGIPPFDDIPHDDDLAIRICNGLRPKIRSDIPTLIVDLIQRCWDSEPSKRLSAFELRSILRLWKNYLSRPDSELANQIKRSEKIALKPLTSNAAYKKHSSAVYTSRLLDFRNLPEPKNSTELNFGNN